MAKELTAADVAAFLASKGMEVPEELNESLANEQRDAATEAISERLTESDEENDKRADEWTDRLFSLADGISEDFTSERNAVGRGFRLDRKVQIETPNGTLFVRLSESAS